MQEFFHSACVEHLQMIPDWDSWRALKTPGFELNAHSSRFYASVSKHFKPEYEQEIVAKLPNTVNMCIDCAKNTQDVEISSLLWHICTQQSR